VTGRLRSTPSSNGVAWAKGTRLVSSQNVNVLREGIAALNRGDVEAALAISDEEVVLIPQRSATEGAYRGHPGMRAWFADTAATFEVFRWDVEELRDLGDRVLAIGKVHIRARGSGIETEVTSAGIATFRDGKMVRWEDFGDVERATEAAGLGPPD
jgi:ketosteroid isomerase-like protein